MSIDSIKSKLLGLDKALLEKNNAAKTSEKVANSAKASKADADNVTLSATSVQLQALESETANNEVFDAEKVEAIKTAIANGEFKVNAEKVADGLLETVKDLIQTKKT